MATTIRNHGTVRGYKAGCRCDLCTHANTKAKQRERDRRREREGKPPLPPRSARVPTPSKPSPPDDDGGPIEAAARRALAATADEDDDPIAELRREVAYRAAAVMDNPKAAPFFKSAAEVLRLTVSDLLGAKPTKDGEADALQRLVDSFGSRGRTRGGAPVDDAEEPEPGDDR